MATGGKLSQTKPPVEKKQKNKKKDSSWKIYIYKVLKNIHPTVGMSKKSVNVMNSFCNDLFDRLAIEASRLAQYNGKQTMSSGDLQAAVQLILPGELGEHAIAEGTRALTQYQKNTAETD
jgi:histone H2B